MFRKLFKRKFKSPLPPMPTSRDSLERVVSLLGCSDYMITDDALNLTTRHIEDSDIIGGIKVRFTIAPPSLTTEAEPRIASVTYTYTTKSSGVQQEFTRFDVTDYPFSATTEEGDENAASWVYSEITRIIRKHELE